MTRTGMRVAGAALAFAAILALGGCSDVLEAILLPDAPSSLEATDGEYAASVALSWNPPDATDENDDERPIGYYEIERSPEFSTFNPLTTTGSETTWTDDDVTAGTLYSYRVRAVFDDSLSPERSDYSLVDTGFAMNATSVKLYPDPDSTAYDVDGGEWYSFPMQRGWQYHVVAATGTVTTASLSMVYGEKLTALAGDSREDTTVETGGGDTLSAVTFVAPESETLYVHVEGPPQGPSAVVFMYEYDE